MTTILPTKEKKPEEKTKPFCLEQPKHEREYSIKAMLLLAVILILSIRLIPPPVPISNDWTEDFEDGTIDGWALTTIHSDERGWYAMTTNGGQVMDGEFHFTEGTAYYHFIETNEFYNYTRLTHPSTIVKEATWSFDCYSGNTATSVSIIGEVAYDIATSKLNITNERYAYRLTIFALPHNATTPEEFKDHFFTEPEVVITGKPFIGINKHYAFGKRSFVAIYESESISPDDWYHITITRKADLFQVFLDEILIISFNDPEPLDTYWSLEDRDYQFCFGSHGGARVDNISVTENGGSNGSNGTPSLDISSLVVGLCIMIIIRRKKKLFG